ncbi:histone H2A [Pseudohyphozyma bogoriensis]|nr:histone H2A [Pseudohyphozyma bogoriensis]
MPTSQHSAPSIYSNASNAGRGKGGKGGGKGGKSLKKLPAAPKTAMRTEKRAGITFPVSRVKRLLREKEGIKMVLYLAAVLEYLIAEILELAGNAASDLHKKRVLPRHLLLAIRNDDELDKLVGRAHWAEGGVLPHIHACLLPGARKTAFLERKKVEDKPAVDRKE